MAKPKRILHTMEQGSPEWFLVRCGKATASHFADVMAYDCKKWGEGAKKYAMRTAVEGITKKPIETFTNKNMEMGVELEPIARNAYEEEQMVSVEEVGFMEYGNVGASTDGLVGKDGMIEIKSVLYNTHFKNIESGYDSSYFWQMQGNMWIYEREWCDFVSYCDVFPEGKKLHVSRVLKDKDAIKRLSTRLDEFQELVDHYTKVIG